MCPMSDSQIRRLMAGLLIACAMLLPPAKAAPKSTDTTALLALRKAQGALRLLTEERAALESEKNQLADDKARAAERPDPIQSEIEDKSAHHGE